MKVVVGLGNPGQKYQKTRHNVGFRVLAELAQRHSATKPSVKFEAEVAEILVAEEKILLVAPQTYMNLSGRCVRKLADYYQLSLQQLLIVCDDINLEPGRLKLRLSGSAGGQRGLENIIVRLESQEVPRLRIGIGQPPGRMDSANYVLGRFSGKEVGIVDDALMRAADCVETWTRDGIEQAMNSFNSWPLD